MYQTAWAQLGYLCLQIFPPCFFFPSVEKSPVLRNSHPPEGGRDLSLGSRNLLTHGVPLPGVSPRADAAEQGLMAVAVRASSWRAAFIV